MNIYKYRIPIILNEDNLGCMEEDDNIDDQIKNITKKASKLYHTSINSSKVTKKSTKNKDASDNLLSGLNPEIDNFYVESNPQLNIEGVQEKTKELHLNNSLKKSFEESTSGTKFANYEPKPGKKKLKKLKKEEREKTKGPKWYNMEAPEITDEVKRDLETLKMRSALFPKRFYKKSDHAGLPKYFQIGQVVDSPADYYSDRVVNKDRKKSLVEELLADAEFKNYNKRKYKEIIEEKNLRTKKAWQNKRKKKSIS